MTARAWSSPLAALLTASAGSAFADAGAAQAAVDAGAAPVTPSGGCVERLPEGRPRPKLTERFPTRGTSGHVATLEVVVEHNPIETVLPGGFRLHLDAAESRALERAHFALPDPDGGAGPSLQTATEGAQPKTTVKIPLVPLPPEPGRHELVLPALPIAIARASGELVSVCTAEHRIVVEDPIANAPDPRPRENPPPREQEEVWTAAKHATIVGLGALLLGALAAWLISRWRRRPRPVPPPPPPRPPWDLALEELRDIRSARLVAAGRFAEHFDRVSDTLRKYLGNRYGFDGLESTTREALAVLRQIDPPVVVLDPITQFLREADLVKFARLTPSEQECEAVLELAETLVHRTLPAAGRAPPADSPSGPAAEAGGAR